jgi:hypothetical protein
MSLFRATTRTLLPTPSSTPATTPTATNAKPEPETFKRYLHLLYTNDMAVVPDPLPKNYAGDEEKIALAKLYVFAEKLQDCSTKDAVVKAMFHSSYLVRSNGIIYATGGLPVIRFIYAGTISGSQMRRLLVDMHTYCAPSC